MGNALDATNKQKLEWLTVHKSEYETYGKHLNYSLSLIYWHETPVSKYSHCYMNICKKNTVHIKNNRTGQLHMAWDVYGVMSVDKCCERDSDIMEYKNGDTWIHQTGFVVLYKSG